jgi:hypothetical protein
MKWWRCRSPYKHLIMSVPLFFDPLDQSRILGLRCLPVTQKSCFSIHLLRRIWLLHTTPAANLTSNAILALLTSKTYRMQLSPAGLSLNQRRTIWSTWSVFCKKHIVQHETLHQKRSESLFWRLAYKEARPSDHYILCITEPRLCIGSFPHLESPDTSSIHSVASMVPQLHKISHRTSTIPWYALILSSDSFEVRRHPNTFLRRPT